MIKFTIMRSRSKELETNQNYYEKTDQSKSKRETVNVDVLLKRLEGSREKERKRNYLTLLLVGIVILIVAFLSYYF